VRGTFNQKSKVAADAKTFSHFFLDSFFSKEKSACFQLYKMNTKKTGGRIPL